MRHDSSFLQGLEHGHRVHGQANQAKLEVHTKRVFDIVFSLIALASSLVLFVGVAGAIFVVSRGPVFFAHRRVGQSGVPFRCYKFRTMHVGADHILAKHLAGCPTARVEYERDQKLKNDPRVIPGVGHFLRKSSLDELPQFLNVLLGQMSVVGPRPVTEDELLRYGNAAPMVLSVRPGITGKWQVSGRNDVTYEQRVAMDYEYVKSWSFLDDLNIIARTVKVVLGGQGAY